MILQALREYYQRKPDLPREGFELKEIRFIIELNRSGGVVQIEDTRYLEGKKKRAKAFLLPQGEKKSVNVAANLLWGNAEYVLGLPGKEKLGERKAGGKEKEYRARLKEMHQAFVKRITNLSQQTQADEGIRAVLRFLSDLDTKVLKRFEEPWEEIAETNPNLTFRLKGDVGLVCQRPTVMDAVRSRGKDSNDRQTCLVTGELDEVERLHPVIKGVRDAQPSGANIVSFNLDAFRSFGKEQGTNAPVGKHGAFAYTTALNHLLARDSKQRIQVGDATTVFWADRDSGLEDHFAEIFDDPPKDDPDRSVRAMRTLLDAPRQGVAPAKDDTTKFFVLGLAPNEARLAVRFWHVGTVAEMVGYIQRHFDDLEIVRRPNEKPYLSIYRLLVSTATLGESKNIPPNLGGDVMRAILSGQPYPMTLFQNAIRRVRAEQAKKDEQGKLAINVTYPRAAIIKACLNRHVRTSQTLEKEMTVTLDLTNTNPGYRLGRLFAVLERIQEESAGGVGKLNSTIRERFYGAASSTPVTVFSNLMKLKNHHLAKLDNVGRRVNLERLIGEIMDGVTDFPAHLDLADQGRFAIGYYHQRQAFFSKSTESKGE